MSFAYKVMYPLLSDNFRVLILTCYLLTKMQMNPHDWRSTIISTVSKDKQAFPAGNSRIPGETENSAYVFLSLFSHSFPYVVVLCYCASLSVM